MKHLVLLPLLFLAGCNLLPSDFDNVEFDRLASLNVMSIHPVTDDWCRESELKRMNYVSYILKIYSKYRLNANIAEIYSEIHSLTAELAEREDPSNTYCKLKRNNIHKATTKALEVFGGRK